MCELLGMSFNSPVKMDISFPVLRTRGRRNPDGWGMAWFGDDNQLRLVKEPTPAYQSQLSKILLYDQSTLSQTFLSRIRLARLESVSYQNTYPFYRHLSGSEWFLGHKGTLFGLLKSINGPFVPIGDTDSELLCTNFLG